jgi:hypothetical protein
MYVRPLADVLEVEPLDPVQWALVLAASLLPLALGQMYRVVGRLRRQASAKAGLAGRPDG